MNANVPEKVKNQYGYETVCIQKSWEGDTVVLILKCLYRLYRSSARETFFLEFSRLHDVNSRFRRDITDLLAYDISISALNQSYG